MSYGGRPVVLRQAIGVVLLTILAWLSRNRQAAD